MKLISLNAYGGFLWPAINAFLREQADSTDVFCLQEVTQLNDPNLPVISERGIDRRFYDNLKNALPQFDSHFAESTNRFDPISGKELFGFSEGVATFWKSEHKLHTKEEFHVFRDSESYDGKSNNTLGTNAFITEIETTTGRFAICNTHGTAFPAHKRDTDERLLQSKKILSKMKGRTGLHIITGDFNLYPDTKSVQLFSDNGYRNLITEFQITTTRGTMNRTLHPEFESGDYGFQEFADYTFVGADANVTAFSVPDLPLSDHLPMLLEIH